MVIAVLWRILIEGSLSVVGFWILDFEETLRCPKPILTLLSLFVSGLLL